MNIILDTNILREDFYLTSSNFHIVFDYLEKTDSAIQMPEIVYLELASLFEREVNSRLHTFKRNKGSLEAILPNHSLPDIDIEVSAEVAKYLMYLEGKLGFSKSSMIPLKDSYLRDVVQRAISRIRPCSDKGEEIRDALLWLTVLDVARSSDQKVVIFISQNIKQFTVDSHSLHPTLLKEAESNGLRIIYYTSIKDFIEDHTVKVDYINEEWLNSVIRIEKVNHLLLEWLGRNGEERLLFWAQNRARLVSHFFNPTYASVKLEDYRLYEMADGSLYVEAEYEGEAEVEFEVEEEIDREASFEDDEDSFDDYLWNFDSYRTKYRSRPLHSGKRIRTVVKTFYPEVGATLRILIKEKKAENLEVIECDIS